MTREKVRKSVAADLEHYVSRFPCIWNTLDIIDRLGGLGISGDLVECGVRRGGHMLLSKAYISRAELTPRKYWLFDTFSGMPEPLPVDVRIGSGEPAMVRWQSEKDWCSVSLADVRSNFASMGLLSDDIVFVEGMVENTLTNASLLPEQIAYLRLDTDFYSSTKTELEVLYPRLVSGGVLVVDDYGHWKGSQMAVDEYFGGPPADFQVIDRPARMLIKP